MKIMNDESRKVIKPEKIALCRSCHGRGTVPNGGISLKCPNCAGSGRVLVSCEMLVHIRPYKSACRDY